MEVFVKMMLRIFNILMIIMFALVGFFAISYMLGGWGEVFSGHEPAFYGLPQLNYTFVGLLVFAITGVFFIIITKIFVYILNKIKHLKIREVISVSMIFLITFIIRVSLIYIFREDLAPFSDFENAWNWAHGNHSRGDYYLLFPAYLNFATYIEGVTKLIGDRFIYVLCLNAVCSSVTSVLIYLITKNICQKMTAGMIAAFLYTFMPSEIVYNLVGTPEYLTICFATLAVFFLIRTLDSDAKKKFLMLAVAGCCLGISSSFKTFGIVIIVAYAIIIICKTFINDEKKISIRIKSLVICLLSVCFICACYKLPKDIILKGTEKNFSVSVDEEATLPHFLVVGLNRQGEGQIHVGGLSRTYYERFLENGLNVEEAKEYAYNLVVDDWKDNKNEAGDFLLKKLIWTWQDHMRPITYFMNDIGLNPDSNLEVTIYEGAKKHLPSYAQVYYFGLILFGFIGCVIIFLKKKIDYKLNFCYLVIFGYFCLMLLAEAQSRYKCLVMPCICIASTIGLWESYKLILTIKNKSYAKMK